MNPRPAYSILAALLSLGMAAAADKPPANPEAKKLVAVKKPVAPLKLPVDPVVVETEMVLKNTDGREMNARLLSASGEMVHVLRLEDEREFDLPITSLDRFSADRVRTWMDRSNEAITYAIDISVTKKPVDSGDFETGGRILEYRDWAYEIKLTNRTRNDLTDASVEYRIVYDDDVDIVRTAVGPGKGSNQQEGEAVSLPTLGYNGRAEFTTAPVRLHSYQYIPLRGPKEFERDRLIGVWVRIVRKDEVIHEFQSYPAVMEGLQWDGSEDIQVIDPFKKSMDRPETTVIKR